MRTSYGSANGVVSKPPSGANAGVFGYSVSAVKPGHFAIFFCFKGETAPASSRASAPPPALADFFASLASTLSISAFALTSAFRASASAFAFAFAFSAACFAFAFAFRAACFAFAFAFSFSDRSRSFSSRSFGGSWCFAGGSGVGGAT